MQIILTEEEYNNLKKKKDNDIYALEKQCRALREENSYLKDEINRLKSLFPKDGFNF